MFKSAFFFLTTIFICEIGLSNPLSNGVRRIPRMGQQLKSALRFSKCLNGTPAYSQSGYTRFASHPYSNSSINEGDTKSFCSHKFKQVKFDPKLPSLESSDLAKKIEENSEDQIFTIFFRGNSDEINTEEEPSLQVPQFTISISREENKGPYEVNSQIEIPNLVRLPFNGSIDNLLNPQTTTHLSPLEPSEFLLNYYGLEDFLDDLLQFQQNLNFGLVTINDLRTVLRNISRETNIPKTFDNIDQEQFINGNLEFYFLAKDK